MIHYHEWKLLSQDAVGYFQKQEGQEDSAFTVPGTVFQCKKCQRMIIEPTDLKLRTVDVVK